MALNEDTLVNQPTAKYLESALNWDESVYAFNTETLGPDGTLGRTSEEEVVLTRYLRPKLEKFNPGLPSEVYDDAIKQLTTYSASKSPLQINREMHDLIRDGVPVIYQTPEGEQKHERLRVIDFADPENNHFLAVSELWVKGDIYRRRPDLIGFVNGLPLVFMEFKNLDITLQAAYDKNFSDYKDTVPHLFYHNALVILANGHEASIGALSSPFRFFRPWKRLAEDEPGVVEMETLLKGTCSKTDLLRLIEHFILFDESSGELIKILAQNQQYLGVLNAYKAIKEREERNGKLGVFWHTQGAGKSYSMVFLTRMVRRTLGNQFTFAICTDREDLDRQIYNTYAGCGLVDNDRDPCRASSGDHLQELLSQRKSHVFTLIQKFNKEIEGEEDIYSDRDDIIVLTDEAHRTQNGILAENMRRALPNASYLGFTGTPLFKDDEVTRRIFGEYVSTYDFQRAVEDNATVKLCYEARGDKLGVTTEDLNEKIASKLEELEIDDRDVAERLERSMKQDYHLITNDKRLDQIARDFVEHYSARMDPDFNEAEENVGWAGKAMFVCLDKVTCVRMYNLIDAYWNERIHELEDDLDNATDEYNELLRRRQIAWMKETKKAVVVSEEQGEVATFRKWDLDIKPHRKLLKDGFETDDGKRIDVETAFKDDDHPFRIAIVCAMWLTGFDVPSLSTLYLDKPMRAHTLMQAIARANRVYEDKNNGLIVDYCGILKNLRQALATYAGHEGQGPIDSNTPPPGHDPAKPAEEELIGDLEEAIAAVRAFLEDLGVDIKAINDLDGLARNKAILDVKEAVNVSDESRKRFEILARAVFSRYKACFTIDSAQQYRKMRDAIHIVYKSLQQDVEKADITDIIRELHEIVDESIEPDPNRAAEPSVLYDISKIDFERLRKEFEQSPAKNTTVQSLKHAVEARLERMMQQNPMRTDFQEHYEQIVDEYNREKDRVTIEQTFEQLLKLAQDLDEEEKRAVREGLNEESLVIYDLLRKDDLSKSEIKRIKEVANELLDGIKRELSAMDNWRDKETTRDAVQTTIKNFLWSDQTGLPLGTYSDEEIEKKSDRIYAHVFSTYSTAEPAVYAS
jgi:type I restriction enzyme R subunit